MSDARFIDLDSLLNDCVTDEHVLEAMKVSFQTAAPFPHLVIDNLFRPDFLRLIEERFDSAAQSRMNVVKGRDEETYRSKGMKDMHPEVKAYFHLVNSEAFTTFLTRVTAVENIIVDATLKGGGLHETKKGGYFGIHRDFDYHADTMLSHSLVVLTYLNRDWREDYGGALELWTETECTKKIYPHFGTTVILQHSETSFHGHPEGLNSPETVTRKSLGSRYYTNQFAPYLKHARRSSTFLIRDKKSFDRAKIKHMVRLLTPPLMWNVLAKSPLSKRLI